MDKIFKFCQKYKIQVILRIQNNFLTTCQMPLVAASNATILAKNPWVTSPIFWISGTPYFAHGQKV